MNWLNLLAAIAIGLNVHFGHYGLAAGVFASQLFLNIEDKK